MTFDEEREQINTFDPDSKLDLMELLRKIAVLLVDVKEEIYDLKQTVRETTGN